MMRTTSDGSQPPAVTSTVLCSNTISSATSLRKSRDIPPLSPHSPPQEVHEMKAKTPTVDLLAFLRKLNAVSHSTHYNAELMWICKNIKLKGFEGDEEE